MNGDRTMAADTIRVMTLVENTASRPDLMSEHGLSFWIQTASGSVLFDAGAGEALPHNARTLGIDLDRATSIVLSHGHYDHCGGLEYALKAVRNGHVYIHPAALDPKYALLGDGPAQQIGMLLSGEEIRLLGGQITWTEKPTEICEGIRVTGEIPRVAHFEDTGGPFFLDRDGKRPDPLMDDQSIFFQTSMGIVVLLGCAHAGVVNTLQHIQHLTDGQPIHAIMGGMHLGLASEERLDRTIRCFRDLDIAYLAPAHCTGFAAAEALQAAFPERFFACNVGACVEFNLPR